MAIVPGNITHIKSITILFMSSHRDLHPLHQCIPHRDMMTTYTTFICQQDLARQVQPISERRQSPVSLRACGRRFFRQLAGLFSPLLFVHMVVIIASNLIIYSRATRGCCFITATRLSSEEMQSNLILLRTLAKRPRKQRKAKIHYSHHNA